MSGFVYFIRCLDAVKIGYSGNPEGRLSKINTDNPNVCSLIGVVDADKYPERFLHDKFRSHLMDGEWYRYSDEIRDFVESNSQYRDNRKEAEMLSRMAKATSPMEKFTAYISRHGNLTRVALALGITPSAVKQWSRVPAERVVEVEKATGIPREQLRPDLYEVNMK